MRVFRKKPKLVIIGGWPPVVSIPADTVSLRLCYHCVAGGVEEKRDIRTLREEEIGAFVADIGEKPYRARQVYEWLWKKPVASFDEMTNLSMSLRTALGERFSLHSVRRESEQVSADGTVKAAFRLHDGHCVEGVLIPAGKRMTACISSQAGCSLTCAFCATGRLGLTRNLSAGEIYDQVAAIGEMAGRHCGLPLSNIVFMGMGEPLLNYRNVMAAAERLTAEDGMAMSPRRITVSTAGIAKMIRKLGDDGARFNLALSLHAADDEKRSRIMPINRQNALPALAEALRHYYVRTKRMVTFEYIAFLDFNDSLKDAARLSAFCAHVPCKVNIIEYNPIEGAAFRQTTPERLEAFRAHLEKKNIVARVRRSRGKDIDAACGQLANKLSQPEGSGA